MNIGNTIRTRRRAKDLTQENLAEMLGVSVSAVSLWESEKTMPDIALIPAICSVLDISADELFEINLEKRTEEIEKIDAEANKYGVRGYSEEALKIIEQGLKKYPDDQKLLNRALHYHHRLGDTDKIIAVGERILEKCTNPGFRKSAIQILCFTYKDKDPARAEKLLEELDTLYVSREVIATHVYKGEKQLDSCQNLIRSALDIMTQRMRRHIDGGEPRYTGEEAATVQEKIISIFHTVFEDGDFGFYHTRLLDAEISLAHHYADLRDAERALDHLEKAAFHAIEFVKFARFGAKEFVNTSLVLRGHKSGGFSTTGTSNNAQDVKNAMQNARYDFVRDTDRFRAIAADLDRYAGAWEKLE